MKGSCKSAYSLFRNWNRSATLGDDLVRRQQAGYSRNHGRRASGLADQFPRSEGRLVVQEALGPAPARLVPQDLPHLRGCLGSLPSPLLDWDVPLVRPWLTPDMEKPLPLYRTNFGISSATPAEHDRHHLCDTPLKVARSLAKTRPGLPSRRMRIAMRVM